MTHFGQQFTLAVFVPPCPTSLVSFFFFFFFFEKSWSEILWLFSFGRALSNILPSDCL